MMETGVLDLSLYNQIQLRRKDKKESCHKKKKRKKGERAFSLRQRDDVKIRLRGNEFLENFFEF